LKEDKKKLERKSSSRTIFLEIVIIGSVLIMGTGFLLEANSLALPLGSMGVNTNTTTTITAPALPANINNNSNTRGAINRASLVPGNLTLVIGFLIATVLVGIAGVLFLKKETNGEK
jgi:hypothetical protein